MTDQSNDTPAAPDLGTDAGYAEAALMKIRDSVRGNGVKLEDVKIETAQHAVFALDAATTINLKTKISEKKVFGQVKGPEKVESPQAMRDLIEKEKVKATGSPDAIVKIKDAVFQRHDKGFGVATETVKLPFLHKEFVFFEQCMTCRAKGDMICPRCKGIGVLKCPRCHGAGLERCVQCQGKGQVQGPQGDYRPCSRCNGERKTVCRQCQQRRNIQCPVCKTRKTVPCHVCQGHAWNSNISIIETSAELKFEYNREQTPERMRTQIDTLGKSLIDHMHMVPVETGDAPGETGKVVIAYKATAPYADLAVSIKGVTEPFFVFGTKGEIVNPPHFLETVLRPGIEKLKAAAKGQGDVSENIQAAGRYRTLRTALLAAARFSKTKAVKILLKNTPMGLGHIEATHIISDAALALHTITQKPRRIGLGIGVLIAAALYAAYFHSPLRTWLAGQLPQSELEPALDALTLAAGAGLAVSALRASGTFAIKKALKKLVPKGKEGDIVPPGGRLNLIAALACLLIFAAILESTAHTGAGIPSWYASLRGIHK